jgi:hypothetical protein
LEVVYIARKEHTDSNPESAVEPLKGHRGYLTCNRRACVELKLLDVDIDKALLCVDTGDEGTISYVDITIVSRHILATSRKAII